VREFEPVAALDGGPDGMKFHRLIIEAAASHLAPAGMLMLEIGQEQTSPLRDLILRYPMYGPVEVIQDYSRDDRVLKVQLRD